MNNKVVVSTLVLLLVVMISLYTAYQVYFHYFKVALCHRVTFWTRSETSAFLSTDPDKYVHNMTGIDLRARNVASAKEYTDVVLESALDFSSDDKWLLCMCCQKADEFFASHTVEHVPMSFIGSMTWKFALTKGVAYEQGYPHTRADTIFLTDSMLSGTDETLTRTLTRTLIHEKIHVYQRKHPSDMRVILHSMGFKPYALRTKISRIRANPDVDAFIYEWKNKAMYSCYQSSSPLSINDVRAEDAPEMEHPYEFMAYKIAANYKGI